MRKFLAGAILVVFAGLISTSVFAVNDNMSSPAQAQTINHTGLHSPYLTIV